jgi:hypothetical protein
LRLFKLEPLQAMDDASGLTTSVTCPAFGHEHQWPELDKTGNITASYAWNRAAVST